MIKLLFFDYRELETVTGFTRRLEPARKHAGNPLMVPDQPWEHGNMQLYGSVIKPPDGPFQMWYSTVRPPFQINMAYAESDDGLTWRRPAFQAHLHEGQPTNLPLSEAIHGPAVIYDPADPDPRRRYKMVAGASPHQMIMGYVSPDGIHWESVRGRWPIIANRPDCPIGLLRTHDGRYACYHRYTKHRRVCRNETWHFDYWPDEPRMVLEPDAHDPPQLQFYGMGAWAYGDYELGSLWNYITEPDDYGASKMRGLQQTELAYSRGGYAWHRLAQNQMLIPAGCGDAWDRGNIQCASQPVFLDDEIRFYYAGTSMQHQVHWELQPQQAGLGLATIKPDRFVALEAGEDQAELLTTPRALPSLELRVNAAVASGGELKLALLDAEAQPIAGLGDADCEPIRGDSVQHVVRFRRGSERAAQPEAFPDPDKPMRLRLRARHARVYSICALEPGETPIYHRFQSWRP